MPTRSQLGKNARLINSSDFSKVLNAKPGVVWRHQSPLFRILSAPRDQQIESELVDGGGARVGLAIAKRLMPRAVDRNRVRRLIRESFRAHQHELPHRDYVFFARQNVRNLDSKEIRHNLDGLMQVIMDHSDKSH